MFSDSAEWYDAIYRSKDYRQESEKVMQILKNEHPRAKTILDVACGTAEHDQYLLEEYSVDGIDVNPTFIEYASKKNPNGNYYVADMTDFNLDKQYDVIVCLFSSIGYVKTIDNVIKTLNCFKKHLKNDGIIILEPWFDPDAWHPGGNVHMATAETEDGKICRMNISERDGNMSFFTFHYLIGTKEGIKYCTKRHELGLFTVDEMKDAFRQVGLHVMYDGEGLTGRGLYLARNKY
jgi:SAM-dependent methyltransferase